jgi:hypothetical protein
MKKKIQSCTTLFAFKGSHLVAHKRAIAMGCEICKTIARLGLDDSAHDLWHCADPQAGTLLRQARPELKQFLRELCAFFLLQRRRTCELVHRRQRLVTLGI